MLSMTEKQSLIRTIRIRYKKSSKKDKKQILDELCQTTGYNRSYARRVLNTKERRKKGSKKTIKIVRKRIYDAEVFYALQTIWRTASCICSSRLKENMSEFIRVLERDNEITFTVEIKEKLLAMGSATIDRMLKKTKEKERLKQLKGKATTKPGTLLKNLIPVKTFSEWNDTQVGFFEVDLVAFCGESVVGDYVNGLNMTDLATGWVGLEAVMGKGQHGVHNAIDAIKQRLFFMLLGLHPDNGAEFINNILYRYTVKEKITFTRSRAYKKNDNAHVEQKNYTVLRNFLGYGRYDTQEQLAIVKQILQLVEPYVNFFQPSVKLIEKQRNGSKVKKKYDKAKTPYQRLLDSGVLTDEQRQQLQAQYETTNPMKLKREIDKLVGKLLKTLRYNLVDSTNT